MYKCVPKLILYCDNMHLQISNRKCWYCMWIFRGDVNINFFEISPEKVIQKPILLSFDIYPRINEITRLNQREQVCLLNNIISNIPDEFSFSQNLRSITSDYFSQLVEINKSNFDQSLSRETWSHKFEYSCMIILIILNWPTYVEQ